MRKNAHPDFILVRWQFEADEEAHHRDYCLRLQSYLFTVTHLGVRSLSVSPMGILQQNLSLLRLISVTTSLQSQKCLGTKGVTNKG